MRPLRRIVDPDTPLERAVMDVITFALTLVGIGLFILAIAAFCLGGADLVHLAAGR